MNYSLDLSDLPSSVEENEFRVDLIPEPLFPDLSKKSLPKPGKKKFKKRAVHNDWIKVYPNPVDREVIIELSEDLMDLDSGLVTVYDQRGIPVRKVYLQSEMMNYALDLSELPSGVYVVNIQAEGIIDASYSIIKR